MATFRFFTLFFCCIIFLLFMQSCEPKAASTEQSAVTEERAATNEVTKPTFETPANFQSQFKEIWQAYLAIKDALVLSDPQQTREKAGAFVAVLHQADTALLESATKKMWIEREKSLANGAAAIKGGKTIGEQRAAFESLSEEIYGLVREVGASGTTVYKQYCPMAFDSKGAFWLSADKEIKNPYFGDAMLSCGQVQEELHFK
ncbi:MAG: DUF3347 domain-containing protein [Bacteroidota bacterium]